MKIEGMNLCVACMHPLNARGECEHCRMDQKAYRAAPRYLLPGSVLADRYILGRVIGEGSFGITYIGWDKIQELIVAVKECYPDELVNREMVRGSSKKVHVYAGAEETFHEILQKFMKEAELLCRFNQDASIVPVRDFFYENNTAYLVMDYIEGIQVKQYVKENGAFSAGQVLELVKPLIQSLDHIHKAGLLHRDISPDNLLLQKNGQLELIDFGSARGKKAGKDQSMTVFYKRGYSPEEQYRRKGEQGPWSDVYALCAVIYYMLTGKVPEEAVQRMILDETLPLSQYDGLELSQEQSEALMKGMAVYAKDRFCSMEELYQALYQGEQKEVTGTASEKREQKEVTGAASEKIGQKEVTGAASKKIEQKEVLGAALEKIEQKEVAGAASEKGEAGLKKEYGRFQKLSLPVLGFLLVVVCALWLGTKGDWGRIFSDLGWNSESSNPATQSGLQGNPSEQAIQRELQGDSSEQTIQGAFASPAEPASTPITKTVVFPSWRGKRLGRVKKALENMHLENMVLVLKDEYSNQIKQGCIIRQSPQGGTRWKVDRDKTVTLWVSKGKRKSAQKNTAAQTPAQSLNSTNRNVTTAKPTTEKTETEESTTASRKGQDTKKNISGTIEDPEKNQNEQGKFSGVID